MNLTDTEIMNFNEFNDNRYFIKAQYTNFSSWPVIEYYLNQTHKDFKNMGIADYSNNGRIKEPEMEYDFSFSICEKRSDDFFEIFNNISKDKAKNLVYSSPDKVTEIQLSEKVVFSKTEKIHKVYNRNYKYIYYKFKGPTSSIIYYVQLLKNAIEFFSMIWGYTEEGEEVCLLKHPIGSIVSDIKDKSKDLIVINYNYTKYGNKYFIKYEVCEILSSDKSSVLEYGNLIVLNEDDLVLSRNSQINNILN